MDTLQTAELTVPAENNLSVEIGRATSNDIEGLARVQWFARKKGVEQGYLPEQVLGLHNGEELSTLTEERGIAYAKGEIERFFYKTPGTTSSMLGAWSGDQLVGKGALEIEKELHRVTLHSLEVLPECQGKGVALTLRDKSIQFVRKEFPSIKIVRLGRYKMSLEFAQKHLSDDSFFNALRGKASIIEDVDSGVPFEWLTVPIDLYEEEVKKRINK